jgi:DNA repair exonuclease SbcCD ATPase subunit
MPRIRRKQPRVIYPGSTILQNYGESGDKGFLLWDIKTKDTWQVDFYPVLNNHPYITVDWNGDIKQTFLDCKNAHASGAKFRIRSSRIIDPKTQHKLSGRLRRELNAKEVVYKVDNKNTANTVATEITEKLEVFDLSKPDVHKELLREYANDESFDDAFWQQVDEVIDNTVPQLEHSRSLGKKWSIKNMKFSNLFGYGENNEIDFQKVHGLVGLFGPNRAGKSSIPGSLMYGLYNSNDRGLVSNAHVVNYRKTWGSATIDVSVDGSDYRLERMSKRYLSKRKGTQGADTKLNLFSLDEDGSPLQDLSGEQRRETEKDVRKLVGGQDEFMMTTFAAQGNMNAFLDKGATDRKKLLSSFMGLDILDELYKKIKNDGDAVKALIKRGAKDWDGLIEQETENILEYKQLRESREAQKIELSHKLEELKLQLREKSGDSYVDPNTVKIRENTLAKFRKTFDDTVVTISTIESELEELDAKIEKYENLRERIPIENLKRRIDLYEALQKTMLTLEGKLRTEKNILKTQERSVRLLEEVPCGDSFPSCKFIADSHKNKGLIEKQRETIDSLSAEYQELSDQVDQLANEDLKSKLSKYDKLINELNKCQLRKSQIDGQIENLTSKLSRLEQDIENTEQEIASLKLKLASDDNEDVSAFKRIVASVQNELSEVETGLNKLSYKLGMAEGRIEELHREKQQYVALEDEWKVYEFLLRATSWRGIPTFVMTKQIPRINAELNKILQDVTGFTIELEVDERNTDLYINYGDTRRPLECGSGMEKMVSSMALRVALSNVSNLSKSDMFIVDEGFGALDKENLESVTAMLEKLKEYYRIILVISHVDVIKDSVDDVIIIERNGQDSKVVYN